jgi:hypothetical protein
LWYRQMSDRQSGWDGMSSGDDGVAA